MVTSGGKRRHDELPRTSPSNSSRNRSRISNIFRHGWIIVAVLTTAVVTARGAEDVGTAATSETGPTPKTRGGSIISQGATTAGVSADEHDGSTRLPADESDGRRLYGFESTGQCVKSPLWRNEVDPANYEFGCKEIEEMLHGPKDLVGHGRVRDVYFVKYKERTVVVKTLREVDNLRREKAHFVMHRREVLALDAVRGHPNIVGMLGVCNTTLVTEYYSKRFDDAIFHDKAPFSINKTVTMALDAARGLRALHEASVAPIVHLDMKPQQLLIDEYGRVKVNDLNSARFMEASPSGRPCPLPTNVAAKVVAWRAPENIAGKVLTEKVDIYSMGMIYYSLIARSPPSPREEGAARSSFRGKNPAIDPSWHKGYMQVKGHPNIVGMLGICNTTLVTEYHATSLDQVSLSNMRNRKPFSTREVVSMALDGAKALQALHEASIAPIVHFDIKPKQMLVDEHRRMMLNDFNAAQFVGARDSGLSCPLPRGGLCRVEAWRAPENIAGKILTEKKVDTYAMGVIFYLLISGRMPFPRSEKC